MVLGVGGSSGNRHVAVGDELDRQQHHEDEGDDRRREGAAAHA
jgi:hypothetical protein